MSGTDKLDGRSTPPVGTDDPYGCPAPSSESTIFDADDLDGRSVASVETDDLYEHSASSSEASDDSGDWETIHVELYADGREWLTALPRGEDEMPPHALSPRVVTHSGELEFPEPAIVHVNTGDCLHRTRYSRTCRARLYLPLRTVPVAVVLMAKNLGWDRLECSLRKARATSIPLHPRIMPTIGFGVSSGHIAVVLPDLGYVDVRTYLRNHPSTDKHRLIAEGLEYFHHQASVVYGLLEMSSVYVTECGDVALDYPVPGFGEPEYRFGFRRNWDLVEKDHPCLQYLSPETVLGEDKPSNVSDAPATRQFKTREGDMYAFGILVYEILSGCEPWKDMTLLDIFRHLVSGRQLPQREDGTIDDSMWNLCTACWNQNPEYRPGIANVLAGLRSDAPPTYWGPDTGSGSEHLRLEWPSLKDHAIPTELKVDISGSVVNIIFQEQQSISGAFGTVIKGYTYEGGIGTAYAVKICRGNRILPREYEIWKSLSHPNILPLLGVVDTNLSSTPARLFVSPYYSTGTLTQYLESFMVAPDRKWLIGVFCRLKKMKRMLGLWKELMRDVAIGLAYLHDVAGVVHGDIKPENILIDDNGTAVLADFGLSTFVARRRRETLLELRQMYTLGYCAPEVLDDTAEDPSAPGVIRSKTKMSDMFAYGVLLYQTYGGGLRQSRRDRIKLMLDMYDGRFPLRPVDELWSIMPGELVSIMPDEFWSICTRCWAREAFLRPTIAIVLKELEDL